jgi:hypothetical protein
VEKCETKQGAEHTVRDGIQGDKTNLDSLLRKDSLLAVETPWLSTRVGNIIRVVVLAGEDLWIAETLRVIDDEGEPSYHLAISMRARIASLQQDYHFVRGEVVPAAASSSYYM